MPDLEKKESKKERILMVDFRDDKDLLLAWKRKVWSLGQDVVERIKNLVRKDLKTMGASE